jgi:curved DNA-binding protein CbpA
MADIQSDSKAYAVLGLEPDADWGRVRQTYRRLAYQWHPDRYSASNPEFARLAEEKLKDINAAYEFLSRTHLREGEAKKPGRPVRQFKPGTVWDGCTSGGSPSSTPVSIWHVPITVVSTLVPLLIFLYLSGDQGSLPEPLAASSQRSAATSRHVPAALGYRDDRSGTHTARDSVPGFGQTQPYSGANTGGGAAMDEAWIGFAAGTKPAAKQFMRGSTKDEVRRVQGAPIFASDSKWTYGASHVYFSGDRVQSWYSSPSNPLRVETRR